MKRKNRRERIIASRIVAKEDNDSMTLSIILASILIIVAGIYMFIPMFY